MKYHVLSNSNGVHASAKRDGVKKEDKISTIESHQSAASQADETPDVMTSSMQVASIIFLESPAFVGWSYSNRTEDRTVGDKRTAEDALSFLVGFFERFPTFKERPFWIAGESYGGVSPSPPPPFLPPSTLPFSNPQYPFHPGGLFFSQENPN